MATKNYTRETYPTREEWLRSGRAIGGSSAAAIVGLSPWHTKLELYNELRGIKDPVEVDSAVMEYGRAMEPLIRKEYAIDKPRYKMRAPRGYEMYRSKKCPLLTATVDGLLTEVDTGRKGIWECKTHDIRNCEDANAWNMGTLPTQYLIQVLHYLLVIDDSDFVELTAKLRFYHYDGETRELEETRTKYYHIERADVLNELTWLEQEELTFAEAVTKGLPPDGEIKF